MSGILAIWRRDGVPLDPVLAETSLQKLAHRGPDGTFLLVERDVALGIQLFRTTPASEFERGPVKSSLTGAIAVSDARLDNRSELIRELRDELQGRRDISDTELILAAYERWNDDCPKRLLGDFAFVVWDPRQRRMFCARDHMGVRQLYFVQRPDLCAVATQIPALVPLLPTRLLDTDLALQFLVGDFWQPERTWFAGVSRVLPAHSLSITDTSVNIGPFWRLDASVEIDVGLDEAVDGFRRIFTLAVKDRLAHPGKPPGVFLSGGLDSSSVACVARDILAGENAGPLQTISAVYDDPPVEAPYRQAVIGAGGVRGRSIPLPLEWKPLSGMADLISTDDEPAWTPFLPILINLSLEAKDAGLDVMLNGEHGDGTAGDGLWYLADLARRLAVVRLLKTSHQVSRHSETSWRRAFWDHGVRGALPGSIRRTARRLIGNRATISPGTYLSPPAERRVSEARLNARDDDDLEGCLSRRRHVLQMSHPYMGLALGLLDRLAASSQVELRSPFADKRLVEFSISLPSEFKLAGGWPRAMLRRAMAGIVPDVARYRPDKGGPNHSFVAAIRGNDRKALRELPKAASQLGGLIDQSGLARLSCHLLEEPNVLLAEQLWRINLLARWLEVADVGLSV